jgi:uncharacterized protein (TIGR02145 family)
MGMKKLFLLIAMAFALNLNAQNYLISFGGTGASTTVSSVKVENLTAGTSLTLNGGDVLRLNVITGISLIEKRQSAELTIYPNPTSDNAVLQISPPVAGEAIISVLDMAGKLVFKIPTYLENHLQGFNLSGLKSGFYLISVTGNNYQYSGKLLCNSKKSGTVSIEKISDIQVIKEKKTISGSKGELATIDMDYTSGDILKFTGTSGIYKTVMTDIPTSNKTITFNFIECTDGRNNNYPVVEIGTQIWMAENLKTTKYNDGTNIPLVQDANTWTALSSPGFCWYNNDSVAYKDIYGALYNWYTADNNKLCPAGWHVPSYTEWATLVTYLGGTNAAGGKLKETGTSHFLSPNAGATNLSGFTGLPGGYRSSVNYAGNFYEIGVTGEWWTTTVSGNTFPDSFYVEYDYPVVINETNLQTVGFSVRCIKD